MAIIIAPVTMANNFGTLIMMAMRLGMNNCESLDKITLVTRLNKKVEAYLNPSQTQPKALGTPKANQTPKAKVTPTIFKMDNQEVVTISGRVINGKPILEGRQMVVTGEKGANLIGFLIHPTKGTLQNSEILMPKINTSKPKELVAQ